MITRSNHWMQALRLPGSVNTGRALRFTAPWILWATLLPNAMAEPGNCPQPRFTGKAPAEYLARGNPLTPADDDQRKAAALYDGKTRGVNCAICHGQKGDGKGPLAGLYEPPPRNFTCSQTINGVPDGQLFWIIRYGSPGTAMPPHPGLDDNQVWMLVSHLRQLAR